MNLRLCYLQVLLCLYHRFAASTFCGASCYQRRTKITTSLSATTPSSSSSSSRRRVLEIGVLVLPPLLGFPQPSVPATSRAKKTAETAPPPPPGDYEGIFSDPDHPTGFRSLRQVNATTAKLLLQDVPQAKVYTFDCQTKYDSRTKETLFSIDFSAKGGPNSVVGLYRNIYIPGIYNGGQIYFQDGNAWSKVPVSYLEGVYFDPKYPNGYRILRFLDSAKISVEMCDEKNGRVYEVSGILNAKDDTIQFDFTNANGQKRVTAHIITKEEESSKIVFDRNEWTKF